MDPIKRQKQQEEEEEHSQPQQSKYIITNIKNDSDNLDSSSVLKSSSSAQTLNSTSTTALTMSTVKTTTPTARILSNLILHTINGTRRLSIGTKPIEKGVIGINTKKILTDSSHNGKIGIPSMDNQQQLTQSSLSPSQLNTNQMNTSKMKIVPLMAINNTVIPVVRTNGNQVNPDNPNNLKTSQVVSKISTTTTTSSSAAATATATTTTISNTPKLNSIRAATTTVAASTSTTLTAEITTTATIASLVTSSNSIGKSVALDKLPISSAVTIKNTNNNNNSNNNGSNNNSNTNNNINNNALLATAAGQAVQSTSTIIRNQTAGAQIKIQQQQKQKIVCKNNAAIVQVKKEVIETSNNNTMISSPRTTLLKSSLLQSAKEPQKQQQSQSSQKKLPPETIILNGNLKSKSKDSYLGKIVITRQQTLQVQQQQQQQQQIKHIIDETKSKGQVLLNFNSKNLLNGLQSKIITAAAVTKAVTANTTAIATPTATLNGVKLTAATANKVSIITNSNKIGTKMITTTATSTSTNSISKITTTTTAAATTSSLNNHQKHQMSLLQLQPQSQQQQQQQKTNKHDGVCVKVTANVIGETNSLLKNNNEMKVLITNGHGHGHGHGYNNNGNNNISGKLDKSKDNSSLLKSNINLIQNKNKDATIILNSANKRLDFIQNFQQTRSEISLLKPSKNNHAMANVNINNKEEVSLLKISNCKVINDVKNILRNGGIRETNNNNNINNNKKQESLLKATTATVVAETTTTSAVAAISTIPKTQILEMKLMPLTIDASPSQSSLKLTSSHFRRSQSLNSTEGQSDVNGERRYSEPLNNNNNKMNDIQQDKQPDMYKSLKVFKAKEIEIKENDKESKEISNDTLISINERPITITTTAAATTIATATVNCPDETQSNENDDDKNVDRNVKLHENIKNVSPHDINDANGNVNGYDDDDDDDVTILPTQEQTEPIEIIDDDDDEDNCYNHNTDAKKYTSSEPNNSTDENIKINNNNNNNNNLSLLCEEQVFMSSSSSGISNNSTEIIRTSLITGKSTSSSLGIMTRSSLSSVPPLLAMKVEKNPLPIVINNNTALLKKTLTESKQSGLLGINDTGYSSVLDVLSNFNMLSWRERVGTARSTNLKFQLNEFNLVQVHERCPPRLRIHTAYEKPINDRQPTRQNQNQSLSVNYQDEAPLLYQCRRCRSYGPAVDFLAPEFCSLHCLKRDSQKRHREDNLRENPKKRSKKADAAILPLLDSMGPKFRWNSYLQCNPNAISAPISLFLNPFPTGPNYFKVGMKLEAIDPENCSLFCVCTVIETNGYRLKLTFDGYDSTYDFWVNADSMDIFPPGWCCKTNHVLQPPKGISYSRFNWTLYLNKERATAAPRNLFTHLNTSSLTPRNPFKIGMHLEAEDLNDTGKLCVATVADVLGDRIRIHFDGWDECYDIIVDVNSPYIHPCGWHEGRQQLVVPPECENSSFNWPDYIRKQGRGAAASEELFQSREPIHFRPQMKLEVVDPRNPSLIRPATVMAHKGHRVKLHLDGWPADYCFWLEDDSPDLHPIGWCETTGHDLEPPPGYQISEKIMPCPITGCRGIGNTRKSSMSVHANRDCCPYAPENWRVVLERPLRLSYEEIVHPMPTPHETLKPTHISGEKGNQNRLSNREILERLQIIDSIKPHHGAFAPKDNVTISVPNDFIGFSNLSTTKVATTTINNAINTNNTSTTIITTNSTMLTATTSQDISTITISTSPSPVISLSSITSASTSLLNTSNEMLLTKKNSFNMDLIDNQYDYDKYSDSDNSMNIKLHVAKRFLCDYGPRLQQNYDLWQTNFDFNTEQIKENPMLWSIDEVAKFIELHLDCSETSGVFKHECIDGTALLMLNQNDLTDNLGLKLGPSVRLYAYIMQLRTLAVTKFNVCFPIATSSK